MNDKHRIIAALVERTGIRIDEHDPAFALVVLNQIMLADSASDAARQIEAAAGKFSDAATMQADDFVTVANEALAKFKAKTNELKATLDNLAAKQPAEVSGVHAQVLKPAAKSTSQARIAVWLIVTFIAGTAFGVGLTFL
jgi:hypothetical protein